MDNLIAIIGFVKTTLSALAVAVVYFARWEGASAPSGIKGRYKTGGKMQNKLNSIIGKALADQEKKSWQEETVVKFRIYIRRTFKRKTWTDSQWFDREVIEQSDKYPSGITEAHARQIAGKDGTVHRVTITTQRIK